MYQPPQSHMSHQSIDKDKIEKSIRKMRAYQKFMKVFSSSKNLNSSKKDLTQSYIGGVDLKKQASMKLKRSNTKKDSDIEAQNKRLNFKEKGKLNSEINNFETKSNKNSTLKITPIPINDKNFDSNSKSNNFSRRSSFGDPINSTRSLNNTQAIMIPDQNYYSIYNSELEATTDFKKYDILSSQYGPDRITEREQSIGFDRNQDLDNVEEFQVKGSLEASNLSNQNEDYIDYTEQLGELNLTMIIQRQANKRNCKSIEPDNIYKSIWDMIGMAMIIYQAIMVPYRLSFGDVAEGPSEILEYIMDCYFIIDIGLSFITGYYTQGNLIMNKRKIIMNYLKTWFVIDLLASFPYTWIFDNMKSNENSSDDYSQTNLKAPQLLRLIRIIRFMRVLKLLRVMKLRQMLFKFEEYFLNDAFAIFVSFSKLFVIMFFIIHWLGCFFFAIGSYEQGYGNENWLKQANLDETDDYQVQYITCIYWAFLTMATIGYGDIYPVTSLEKCYVMVCMIIACALFAYIVGYIGSTLEKSDTIKQFMAFHNLPANFKNQVKRYLDHIVEYKRQYKMEEEDVLEMLSEGLRLELVIHLNGKMLHNTSIFKNFDIQFLSELTFILKKETLTDDYKLFDEGNQGSQLFFITRGNIILVHRQSHTYIKELGCDDFLGEVAFFSDQTRQATARSKGMTEVLVLDQVDFINQAYQYPNVVKTYLEMKRQVNEDDDLTELGVMCYLCESIGHVAINCAMFNVIRGNLKKHAFDKLKQIQKIITQKTKRRLRRQTGLSKGQNDSIETESDFDQNTIQDNISYIREATNEDDESEQIENEMNNSSPRSFRSSMVSEEPKLFQNRSLYTDDETEDKVLDYDKIHKSNEKQSQDFNKKETIRRQKSIIQAKDKIKENSQKSKELYKKRNSILKSLTFKAQTKSKSPPTTAKSKFQIHEIQIEEEKSESGSSQSSQRQNQQRNRLGRKKSSLRHAVTMKELSQIITKVKINTDTNSKIQKNSMIARGIKYALREINKEIKRKSMMPSPLYKLELEQQVQKRKQETKADPLKALAKKFHFLNNHHNQSMQSQEILSTSKLDQDINSKIRNLKKVGTLKDSSTVHQAQSTPKMRNMSSTLGGNFSLIQHAISSKFKKEIRNSISQGSGNIGNLSHQSSNVGFSKLALPKMRSNYSKQGTFYEMEKLSHISHSQVEDSSGKKKTLNYSHSNSKFNQFQRRSENSSFEKRFKSQVSNVPSVIGSVKNFRQLSPNIPVKTRQKSILINGAVPIPDDLNLSMLEEIIANISIHDSLNSSSMSSENSSSVSYENEQSESQTRELESDHDIYENFQNSNKKENHKD